MRAALLPGLVAGLLAAEPPARIRIAQIGTSHAHASGKMDALRSLSDLYEVVGFAEPIASRQAAAAPQPPPSCKAFLGCTCSATRSANASSRNWW